MPLTDEDKDQLYGELENEGFGYWVQNYGYREDSMDGSDQKLKELCLKAKDAMDNLHNYLREIGVED